jgi:hypothetical protein
VHRLAVVGLFRDVGIGLAGIGIMAHVWLLSFSGRVALKA